MRLVLALFLFIGFIGTTPLQAADKVGVILMHGKWGTSLPRSPIGKLANSLKRKGFIVLAPDMPWSRDRRYDSTYQETMAEIDEKVKKLKKKGATKIVVGGHSMGANAAFGYGARYEGVDGILAIAAGHLPEVQGFQNKMDNDWRRAKELVDSGNGAKKENFNDINQGKKRENLMKAEVYLSWFDPNGPAVIPVNAANLKPGTALLWIIGEKDRLLAAGEDYAYSKAPANEKSAYIVVKGGHKVTPQKGESEIIDWLNSL